MKIIYLCICLDQLKLEYKNVETKNRGIFKIGIEWYILVCYFIYKNYPNFINSKGSNCKDK